MSELLTVSPSNVLLAGWTPSVCYCHRISVRLGEGQLSPRMLNGPLYELEIRLDFLGHIERKDFVELSPSVGSQFDLLFRYVCIKE